MTALSPKATCRLCGKAYSGRGMKRHIRSCLPKHLQGPPGGFDFTWHYLVVTAPPDSDYFLHLLVSGTATLRQLDSFLRKIWLECCGHMSAFMEGRFGPEISMSRKVKTVFRYGRTLVYHYDFGDTTELLVTAVDVFDQEPLSKDRIQILVRNAPPLIPCDECGRVPAVDICSQCVWEGHGWLCRKCSDRHPCDHDFRLPVVNSPRAGVCAYCGEYDSDVDPEPDKSSR